MILAARRQRAFTLIEVLVALALVGLVSLLMLHGIGFAARGLDRLSHHADRLDERRNLEMLLRRAFASVVPTATTLPPPSTATPFAAENEPVPKLVVAYPVPGEPNLKEPS